MTKAGATITTRYPMTWDEWVVTMEHLEARAALAERNGLRHTAKSWRDAIEALSSPVMEAED
jgi:hypothetical protein